MISAYTRIHLGDQGDKTHTMCSIPTHGKWQNGLTEQSAHWLNFTKRLCEMKSWNTVPSVAKHCNVWMRSRNVVQVILIVGIFIKAEYLHIHAFLAGLCEWSSKVGLNTTATSCLVTPSWLFICLIAVCFFCQHFTADEQGGTNLFFYWKQHHDIGTQFHCKMYCI